MEPENQSTTEVVETTNQETWYAPLTRVTPLSNYLALSLFIILPALGFWLGFNYVKEMSIIDEQKNIEEVTNFIEDSEQPSGETDEVILGLFKEISDKYEYSFSEPGEENLVWLEDSSGSGMKSLELEGYSIGAMDFSLFDTDAEYGRKVIRLDKEIFDLLRAKGFVESLENETDHPTNQSSIRGFYDNSNDVACLRIIEDSESEFSGYEIICANIVDNEFDKSSTLKYTNDEYGFSILYPKDWSVTKEEDRVVFGGPKFSGECNIFCEPKIYANTQEIPNDTKNYPTIYEWFISGDLPVLSESFSTTTLGGQLAVRAVAGEGMGRPIYYYVKNGNNIISISYARDHDTKGVLDAELNYINDLNEEIISSVKFY